MPHVLIVSHELVGPYMAGPGIRYRELASVLSRESQVTLAVPGTLDLRTAPYRVWPYRRDQWNTLAPAANRADVVVACGDTLADFPALTNLQAPLVIDGYDPHTIETLALWAGESAQVQIPRHAARLDILRNQCEVGDFFICASERQRDWWLGLLEHHGRINPKTYASDPSLRQLIDVVPYGLPPEPPKAGKPVIRGKWSGVSADDQIVLWGGGLWEWLDPLTAVRAMERLAERGPSTGRIRLVFPGTRHPNPAVPDMPVRQKTLALTDELGLTGRSVFFGDWVPWEDWPALLLEADVGLSLHPNTVEARLAYRSRVMDYVWAGLPMVVTRGDAAADLVERYGLGLVVDYGDDAAVAEGIVRLLDRASYANRFDVVRHELTWDRAAEPLVAFCRQPHRAPDRQLQSTRSWVTKADTMVVEKKPSMSVVVLTWNGTEFVDDCLTAILTQDYPKVELVVVDNGSTDGTPQLVAERFPSVKLVPNKRNLGFAAGNNVGLGVSSGDVIVLLNQDTQVQAGWLAALARAFDDPAAGIVGSKLLYPNGEIQHAGGYLFGPRGEADHVGRHSPDREQFDQPADAEYVTGAALAIRRAALQQIGPLDEGFWPAYYEDIDWCYRARASGYRVVYEPRAVVMHHESASADARTYWQKLAVNRGRLRFLFKHRTLDQLLHEFGPAEMAWIPRLGRSDELMAARQAYLQTLLAATDILTYRGSTVAEADLLIGLLADLRAATMLALPDQAPQAVVTAPVSGAIDAPDVAQVDRLQELRKTQTIAEQPFKSRIPVLGSLIAGARTAWNSVSTKWYVRSLIQQQNTFNALLVRYLQEQASQMQEQTYDVTGAVRESTAMAEHVAWLEVRRAQLPSARPASDDCPED